MKKPKTIEPCPDERTHSVKQLATFSEVGKTLTSTLNLSEILNTVMKQISELIQPKNWSLMLVDEDKKELYFEIAVGDGAEKIKGMRFKIGEGIAGWVSKEGKSLLVPDVNKEPRFSRKADQRSEFKTKSIVCVPLMTKGKCHGVIELINKVELETL
jgi:GAF domain-containing protein